ncbi:hypothetical protein [Nocardiopsis sp. YSL2]|uniref:hypothetical protein n=1 Tax=Nocardiopsis sp. YSL2 TaxID=2939492 RepID=UPI0026F463F3|nr:hypothetical protein [Nocardiopsis sp. YSL2]
MISIIFSLLLSGVAFLVVGAIALIRAGGAPSGRGLIRTSGALFVLLGLASIGWNVYLHVFAFPMLDPNSVAPPGLAAWAASIYSVVTRLVLLVAILLLVLGVVSARGRQNASQRTPAPVHGGPGGYGPQPGRAPDHGYAAQQPYPGLQGHYGQHVPQGPGGPQQPQQPQQGSPTGPRNPYQQPPQRPDGPQQPPTD